MQEQGFDGRRVVCRRTEDFRTSQLLPLLLQAGGSISGEQTPVASQPAAGRQRCRRRRVRALWPTATDMCSANICCVLATPNDTFFLNFSFFFVGGAHLSPVRLRFSRRRRRSIDHAAPEQRRPKVANSVMQTPPTDKR